MIQDLRHLPDGQTLEADLCIVGAGPAGICLARELDGLPLRVVLAESGGLGIEAEIQRLNAAESVGLPHTGHTDGRARAFGGAAKLWAGQCLRLDPIDHEARAWVPYSGWPFGPDELAPYYDRAEAFLKVAGQVYDERNYALLGLPAPAWSPEALRTVFTVYTPEVDSGRFHLAALRRSKTVQVLLHANAVEVETDGDAAVVTGVKFRTLAGAEATVRARAVVLAGGGIENARLLLVSDRQQPNGLGNAHDLVGRFFQEHPNAVTATVEGGDLAALEALFRLRYQKGLRYFPKFSLSPTIQRAERLLNCNAHLVFEHEGADGLDALRQFVRAARQRRLPDRPLHQLSRLFGDLGSVGNAAAQRYVRGRSPTARVSAVRLQCYLEQAPDPRSRIALSHERDALGVRRARVDWRVGELERATLHAMTRTVGREFARLGFGRLRPEVWLDADDWDRRVVDCYHHIGTTRMGDTVRDGVVDPSCQVFGVDGLYVAGSSVFPTSGYANPTLCILALAMRLANHLRARLVAGPRAGNRIGRAARSAATA